MDGCTTCFFISFASISGDLILRSVAIRLYPSSVCMCELGLLTALYAIYQLEFPSLA